MSATGSTVGSKRRVERQGGSNAGTDRNGGSGSGGGACGRQRPEIGRTGAEEGQRTYQTIIEWPYGGYDVQVFTSWDGKWTALHRNGQLHWMRYDLPAEMHDVWIKVDGEIQFHPNMNRNTDNGPVHFIAVNLPQPAVGASHVQPQLQPEAFIVEAERKVPVPITFKEDLDKDEYVFVEGSWSDLRERMERSNGRIWLREVTSTGIL